jgi:hypothetical protein
MTTTLLTQNAMAKIYSDNSLNPAAMFRALGDVAERHTCISFDFQSTTDFDFLHASGAPERLVVHGMDCSATFRFVLDEPTLRLALGAAYKRHSGNDAPFLSRSEHEAVNSGRYT